MRHVYENEFDKAYDFWLSRILTEPFDTAAALRAYAEDMLLIAREIEIEQLDNISNGL